MEYWYTARRTCGYVVSTNDIARLINCRGECMRGIGILSFCQNEWKGGIVDYGTETSDGQGIIGNGGVGLFTGWEQATIGIVGRDGASCLSGITVGTAQACYYTGWTICRFGLQYWSGGGEGVGKTTTREGYGITTNFTWTTVCGYCNGQEEEGEGEGSNGDCQYSIEQWCGRECWWVVG